MKHKSEKAIEKNWCYVSMPIIFEYNARIKLLRTNFSFHRDFVDTKSLNLTITSLTNPYFSLNVKVRMEEYRIQKRDKNFSNNRTLDFFNLAINVSWGKITGGHREKHGTNSCYGIVRRLYRIRWRHGNIITNILFHGENPTDRPMLVKIDPRTRPEPLTLPILRRFGGYTHGFGASMPCTTAFVYSIFE